MGTRGQLQINRGTASQIALLTPALSELWHNTTNNSLIIGDGATLGGIPVGTVSVARAQRSVVTSGDLPVRAADSILNVNAASDLAPVVPLAISRSGAALTFKVKPGAHSQTITATSPDTFDGATTISLAAGQGLTLVPYNDGVNAGYAVE